ncbi:odorant receptor 10-like [Megalopta genalis]|uniref:odorant receptor 10-like n=1 Tax=Megalopta genalis TaxID=115081 RepID=UPI003FD53DD7
MERLTYVCNLLGVCGCWIPDSWTSSSKRVLYCTYSAFVWLVLHLLSASQFCDLFINVKTQDDFTDNFYVTLSVLCICVKMSNLLLARRHLGNMIERIQKEPFSPTSVEEEEIRTRYDRLARRNAVVYTIAINSYVVSTCAMSLFTGYRKHKLLYRAWLPYDYSTAVRFSAAYIHQVVALFYAGLITVASDSLFNGFLIHTYCHFEILKHRLETIATEKSCSLKRCLHLHDRIYTYANTLNSQFKVIMVIQSMVSIVTVCCNLYQLTQKNLGSKFLEVIVYSFNTLVQIFYYCWYGNEIKLKSLDVPRSAFECNWTILDDKAKKFLLMMIKRAKVPIEFSVVHVVSMDLEMFTKILKTSYSAYNLMQ